jgi:hypothetical protein
MKNSRDRSPEIIIDNWAEHFNNGNLEYLLNMYHEEATLLPTFLPNLLSTPEQIEDYFVRTIESQASVEIEDSQTIKRKLSENMYLMTGAYVFCLKKKSNIKYLSWFTFLIDLSVDSPIMHHHSSRVPFEFALGRSTPRIR